MCGGWSVHAMLIYVVSVLIMVYTGRLLCVCACVCVLCIDMPFVAVRSR